MKHVQLEERTLVFAGAIVDVYKDKMRLPNGKTEDWDMVKHRKGAAAVIPVFDDGRVLMVHQYRHALERMTWEIPAGSKDVVGEEGAVCARRELEEETGYRCSHIEHLLSLKTTVAFCDESVDVYLATGLTKGEQHLDEAESIEVRAWELQELLAEVYAGRIQDSKTVSAILAYALKRRES